MRPQSSNTATRQRDRTFQKSGFIREMPSQTREKEDLWSAKMLLMRWQHEWTMIRYHRKDSMNRSKERRRMSTKCDYAYDCAYDCTCRVESSMTGWGLSSSNVNCTRGEGAKRHWQWYWKHQASSNHQDLCLSSCDEEVRAWPLPFFSNKPYTFGTLESHSGNLSLLEVGNRQDNITRPNLVFHGNRLELAPETWSHCNREEKQTWSPVIHLLFIYALPWLALLLQGCQGRCHVGRGCAQVAPRACGS